MQPTLSIMAKLKKLSCLYNSTWTLDRGLKGYRSQLWSLKELRWYGVDVYHWYTISIQLPLAPQPRCNAAGVDYNGKT